MTAQTQIGANDGRIQTSIVGASSGSYAIDFPFVDLDDVIVTTTDADGVITTLTRGVHYNITATANDDGIYPSGSLTFISPVSDVTLTRYRNTSLERLSQLSLIGFLSRVSLNADLNRVMMAMQDFDRRRQNALHFPEEDGTLTSVLPAAHLRIDGTLIFDSEGRPTIGAPIETDAVISSYWLGVLQRANAALSRSDLGAVGLADNNVWTGTNGFNVSPTVPNLSASDGSTKAANAKYVDDAVAAITPGGGFDTGDVKFSLRVAAGSGWVLVNDGSIGDASSSATTRANADTSDLFTYMYDHYNNTLCPVSGGRGTSAAADFAAHKRLTLTKMLGRAIFAAGAGSGLTNRAIGTNFGEESHVLIAAEQASMPTSGALVGFFEGGGGQPNPSIGRDADVGSPFSGTFSGTATGGGGAHNNTPAAVALNVFLRL